MTAQEDAREELRLVSMTVGEIVTAFMEQSQAKGWIPRLDTGSFTAARDSRGNRWDERITLDVPVGASLEELLNDLHAIGVCEWSVTTELRLYAPGTEAT